MKLFKREEEPKAVEMATPVACYLAGPFTGLDIHEAVNIHRTCAEHLVRLGYSVYSPILNTVPVWLSTQEDNPHPWWEELERRFIKDCDVFVAIITTNSFLSDGLRRELQMAEEHNLLVRGIIPLSGGRFIVTDLPTIRKEVSTE